MVGGRRLRMEGGDAEHWRSANGRKWYHTLLAVSPDYVFLTDIRGRIVDANPAFVERLGTSLARIKRMRLAELAPAYNEVALTKLRNGDEATGIELQVRDAQGETFFIEISAVPLQEQGVMTGILNLGRDITERKATAEILQRRTNQQKRLLETAQYLATSLDTTEVLARIAASAKDMLDARDCVLYLLGETGQTLAPVVCTECSYKEAILASELGVNSSFTGQAVKARKGMVFNEAWENPSGCQIAGTPSDEDENVIVAPLIADGRVLGAMCANRMGVPFTDEDLALAEAFAAFAATALKNAQAHEAMQNEAAERKRMEDALRREAERIEHLDTLAHHLEACDREEDVLRLTAEGVREIVSCDLSSVTVVDEGRLATRVLVPGSWPEDKPRPSVDGEAALLTLEHAETRVLGRRTGLENPLGGDPLKSQIAAPLGDAAVVQVFSSREDAFSTEDARLLELLLGHAAQALKRIRLQAELREQAIHDPLTGVYNRYYLREALQIESARATRHGRPIGFLMIDLDRLKSVNDTFGHLAGDRLLQAVARLLQSEVRDTDMVVRYGGDEFLVVLPEAAEHVQLVVDRVLKKVPELAASAGLPEVPVTLSIGSAHWHPNGIATMEQILNEADNRMYEHKRARRQVP
jgi:diguanylate cyclase (GGDEF)-like protein/PAS domain S-box-containing protein